MTLFTTSIPHENYRHFRSDEQFHHDQILMSFDDSCRSLVLPSEAKIADREIASLCTSCCSGIDWWEVIAQHLTRRFPEVRTQPLPDPATARTPDFITHSD